MTSLAEVARRAEEQIAAARADLVWAVRSASAKGMTQVEIAREIGRSQPEVSRLLKFHGSTPLARQLRKVAPQVRALIAEQGGASVRVFGSVALGTDTLDSDVDLLFDMRRPLSLMEMGRLEQDLAEVIGAEVDLVPESSLRPGIADRVLAEAVPL